MTLHALRRRLGLDMARMAARLGRWLPPWARLGLRAYYLLERGRANDNRRRSVSRVRGKIAAKE